MQPGNNNRRRNAMVAAGLSAGPLSPQESASEEIDEGATEDGTASLLSVPIRRAKKHATASPAPRSARDLTDYWQQLRGDKRFPSPSDLHGPAAIAAAPPGQLMTCTIAGRLILVDKILATAPSVAEAGQDLLGRGPHMTTVLDWLQQLGRRAARMGQPVEATEVFNVNNSVLIYRGVVLPLSRDQRNVDQLLCHLQTEHA